MKKSIQWIKSWVINNDAEVIIARKVYLSYMTEVFRDDEDREFYIKNSIASNFKIPFSSIEIVWSAKTWLSFVKDKVFVAWESDLDVAIISHYLFNKFLEISHRISKGYSDLTVFPVIRWINTHKQFRDSVTNNGFFNPFLMPDCSEKFEWFAFFNKLSNPHFDLFKNINWWIYLSEYFFEQKQLYNIEKYNSNPTTYDSLSS